MFSEAPKPFREYSIWCSCVHVGRQSMCPMLGLSVTHDVGHRCSRCLPCSSCPPSLFRRRRRLLVVVDSVDLQAPSFVSSDNRTIVDVGACFCDQVHACSEREIMRAKGR